MNWFVYMVSKKNASTLCDSRNLLNSITCFIVLWKCLLSYFIYSFLIFHMTIAIFIMILSSFSIPQTRFTIHHGTLSSDDGKNDGWSNCSSYAHTASFLARLASISSSSSTIHLIFTVMHLFDAIAKGGCCILLFLLFSFFHVFLFLSLFPLSLHQPSAFAFHIIQPDVILA